MSTQLQVHEIRKQFGATVALNGVSFGLQSGEVLALVGENGSGKSTVSRVIAGVIAPDSGSMTLNGVPFDPKPPHAARGMGVAMIYQELSLCAHLTVGENIALGMERTITPAKARSALDRLGASSLSLRAITGELPPATRQLVEIARALASDAKVIIFDEPTSSLTSEDAKHLFEVIESLRADGTAILYISHFLEEIERLADRVVILRDGELVSDGPKAGLTREMMIERMVGRELDELYPRSARTFGEPLLRIDRWSGRRLPVEAQLEVRRGEVVGIAGLNGAGRTELLRTIFGLDPIRSGTCQLAQYDGWQSPKSRWNQGMGMLSEDRKEEGLALGLSLADNAMLPSLRPGWVRSQDLETQTKGLIDRLGVRCREPGQIIGELSGGNQQKIALARLLIADVDCFLLDEPTRGIDVGSKQTIYRAIDEAAQRGKSVLMVSSYLPELLGVCDRIAVMTQGRLGPAHPVAECDATSLMQEALGLAEVRA
ncbi:MAG: sugar ABC transporter ATP-binding protein [Fimbriimonas sp.]